MRRRLASAIFLSAILTGCGLAALASPAVAPQTASQAGLAEEVSDPGTAKEPGIVAAPLDLRAPLLPKPVVLARPAQPASHLGAMKHVWQSLNNCGPAAVVMALSTLGIDESQEVARLALRGPDPRRGMGPQGVGPWVEERYGLRAIWRIGGTHDVLKQLVTNGFAPMVTQWMEDPAISRTSHWRTVRGYDDARAVFYVNDPMLGNNVPLGYGWFAKNWQTFAYRYMVIYRPEDEPLLRSILGVDWDNYAMRERHYERAKAEALAQKSSQAWLAYGEAAYQFGLFEETVVAIEKGLSLGSGTGIFMLRSSLPNALRALGRFEEADAAQKRLASVTPGVSPAASSVQTTFRLDAGIAAVTLEREQRQRAWDAAEHRLEAKLDRDR